MPICPHCSSSIHSGAEQLCPFCGYGMERADALFGSQDIEFTRIVDEAGALTHDERVELLGVLENLERRISPATLCIYITDHGKLKDFRPHAHWALNHVRIHHASFGKRQQMRAIEDAALLERRPGEARPAETEQAEPVLPVRLWQNFCNACRDLWLPNPPPVQPEWIFMLVLDVQLEVACFSWGYMLDPYVNPDKINAAIVGSRLQFRERAMVTALKRVMKAAVKELVSSGRRVNRKLWRAHRASAYATTAALATGAGLLALGQQTAAQEPAAPAPPTQEQAVPAEQPPAEQAPAPAPPPPVVPGVPAAYNVEPKWSSEDYTHLMSGRLTEGFNLLLPGGKQKETAPATERSTPRRADDAAESDITVPARYCRYYMDPRGTALRDPQMLLTDVERADVAHVLRELNAHSRFHLYVSVFKVGQEVPQQVAVANLVSNVSEPGQYVVMLQYSIGEPAQLDIAYREVNPTDAQVRDWLQAARESVAAAGGGADGLIAAIRCMHGLVEPLSEKFVPLTPETAETVRKIDLPLQEEVREKEISAKEKLRLWWEEGNATPYLFLVGSLVAVVGFGFGVFVWYRHSCRLVVSDPDYRLGSRYGAGVSRYVRYLEGKEAEHEKKLP